MRLLFACFSAAILAAAARAEDPAPTAAECITIFTTADETTCDTITQFAKCLASSADATRGGRKSDFLTRGERVLATAQEESRVKCNLEVSPSFKVIDRELRVITQEDVRFQRFRRDDVGVFELKGMIEKNTERVAAAEQVASDNAQALESLDGDNSDTSDKVETLTTRLAAAEAAAATLAGTVGTNKGACTDGLAKLAGDIKKLKDDSEKAAATEVEVAASWLAAINRVHPTNKREATDIVVVGKNFEQYDFTPAIMPYVECTFALSTDAKKTHVTEGQTKRITFPDAEAEYQISCPSPRSIATKSEFELSLQWVGGEDAVKIPFKGAAKLNMLLFDMTWSALRTLDNTRVQIDVAGLDERLDYTCRFTQPDNSNIVRSSDAVFHKDSKGKQMDCGVQPSGFAISGSVAPVIFELLIKGSRTKATYAGPQGFGPVVKLDVCKDGKQSGDETDKDCGGPCKPCQPTQKCKVDNDCQGDVPCKSGICGRDGLTKQTAGLTCKGIKLENKDSKNGFYWVTGPGKEYTIENGKGPKKVACWMESRDGGGWTLAMKHYYGQHHNSFRNQGNGRRAYNNIDSGVMKHLGEWFKLDDRDIRLFLGQENHLDDSSGAKKSSMSFMRDQNGRHTGHSNSNREYTIMKKYTGRWYFAHGNRMPESTTTSELSSWAMSSEYDGSFNDMGDGTLNWRGNAICGPHGTSGINCYNSRSGSPNTRPNGGHGCRANLGRGWSGALHWYMMDGYDTYTYVCNAAQHSSHNRFSDRIWVRTPDDNKEW